MDDYIKNLKALYNNPLYSGIFDTLQMFKKKNMFPNIQDNSALSIASSFRELAMQNNGLYSPYFLFENNLSWINKHKDLIPKSSFEIYSNSLATQLSISTSLSEIIKNMHKTEYFQQANSLNSILHNISSGYIKDTVQDKNWENINQFEEIAVSIESFTEEIENSTKSPEELIEDYHKRIVEPISLKLEKIQDGKLKNTIFNVINVISFILTVYIFYTDAPNNKVLEKIEEQTKIITKAIETSNKIHATHFKINSKERIALSNVNLREKSKRKSKKLGVVTKGQIVKVILIKHKWIYVSYIDDETGEPNSGFVYKKYFEKIKN